METSGLQDTYQCENGSLGTGLSRNIKNLLTPEIWFQTSTHTTEFSGYFKEFRVKTINSEQPASHELLMCSRVTWTKVIKSNIVSKTGLLEVVKCSLLHITCRLAGAFIWLFIKIMCTFSRRDLRKWGMKIDYTALYSIYFIIHSYTKGPSKFGTTIMWTWDTILGFRLSSSTLPNMLEEIKPHKQVMLLQQELLSEVNFLLLPWFM